MRVSIEHSETTKGFFSKTTLYVVTVSVQFTEEEKAIIKRNKLGRDVLMERGIPADINPSSCKGQEDIFDLRVNTLVDGPSPFAFRTPLDAKVYEREVTEKLKMLKEYIEANRSVENKSTTFEL